MHNISQKELLSVFCASGKLLLSGKGTSKRDASLFGNVDSGNDQLHGWHRVITIYRTWHQLLINGAALTLNLFEITT